MNDPQEKILEYKLLFQQFQKIQQQTGAVEQHLHELGKIKETIEVFSKTPANTEAFIPLGSGIFFKGILKDNQTLLMNVGANVCVKKDITQSLATVQQQTLEIEQLLTQLENEAVKLETQLEELKKEIQP